ncbi:MAG: FtsH protease activity modulator HflK [Candidatus Hydrogenedentes bacterium]|nr:FtsH protease activity modulator HflK [Candidatus Hydrogenedentota bacterium]
MSSSGKWASALIKPLLLTLVVLPFLYLLSGVRTINADEQALVLRFGKQLAAPLLPGTHYTFPYPVDRVYLYKPSEVKSVVVGITNHRPYPQGIQSASYSGSNVGVEFLAGDESIIELEMNVQYQIKKPAGYLFRTVDADRLVVIACETVLTSEMARSRVDDILTSGRLIMLTKVKIAAQKMLEDMEAGITIIAVNLSRAVPPARVADAFKDVASALEDKDRLINDANGLYSQVIPETRGEAIQITQEALADKNGAIKRAQGEADRFKRTLAELRQTKDAELSVLRLYLESMESIMPNIRKYIIDTDSEQDK